MHSSRMRIVRCSGRHWGWMGGCLPGEVSAWGLSAQGVCPEGGLPREDDCPGGACVCSEGGLPWGNLPRGGVCSEEGVCPGVCVCLSAQVGCLPGGVFQTTPQTE